MSTTNDYTYFIKVNANRCRICLNTADVDSLLSLFFKNEVPSNDEDLLFTNADLIMMCSSLQIEEDDGFPQNICTNCHKNLLDILAFKVLCEKSDKLLHDELSLIKCIKSDNDIEIENADEVEQVTIQTVAKVEHSCPICFEEFVYRKDLAQHLLNCDKLKTRSQRKMVKKEEIITEHEITEENNVVNEEKEISEPDVVTCTICGEDVSNLPMHQYQIHGRNKCEECNKKFSKMKYYIAHVRCGCLRKSRKHLCSTCGRYFTDSANYKVHMRIHTGEKPYECQICERRFTQWVSLQSHKATHNPVKDELCPICNKAFNSKIAVRKHMISHSNVRKFSCEVCNKTFKQSFLLKRHMVVHSGVKPYKCIFCTKDFSFQKNLVVHLRTHTGEKPYQCEICLRSYSQRISLRAHMKQHLGDN